MEKRTYVQPIIPEQAHGEKNKFSKCSLRCRADSPRSLAHPSASGSVSPSLAAELWGVCRGARGVLIAPRGWETGGVTTESCPPAPVCFVTFQWPFSPGQHQPSVPGPPPRGSFPRAHRRGHRSDAGAKPRPGEGGPEKRQPGGVELGWAGGGRAGAAAPLRGGGHTLPGVCRGTRRGSPGPSPRGRAGRREDAERGGGAEVRGGGRSAAPPGAAPPGAARPPRGRPERGRCGPARTAPPRSAPQPWPRARPPPRRACWPRCWVRGAGGCGDPLRPGTAGVPPPPPASCGDPAPGFAPGTRGQPGVGVAPRCSRPPCPRGGVTPAKSPSLRARPLCRWPARTARHRPPPLRRVRVRGRANAVLSAPQPESPKH